MTATISNNSVRVGSPQLQDLLGRIAAGAQQREQDLIAPHEQIQWLRDAGVGRLRIPVEEGGGGATLPELFGVVIDLAAADSNIAHILRAHFGFVEERLHDAELTRRQRWIELINAGNIFGNAVSEQNGKTVGRESGVPFIDTTLSVDGAGFRLTGVKFYSTGTLYADWVTVQARGFEDSQGTVTIPVARDGVTVSDDWDGFGQRLTGTGTTRFDNVWVHPDEVHPFRPRGVESDPTIYGAFYQLYLQAVTAGVLQGVQQDAVALIRGRTRNFSHAVNPLPSADPQVLQVLGEIAADAYAARAIVLTTAETLQLASDHFIAGGFLPEYASAAQLAAAKAKVAIDRFSYATAARLFDVGGASATQSRHGLDRHWRNIRTISAHNPTFLKATAIGGQLVNGTPLPQNGYF